MTIVSDIKQIPSDYGECFDAETILELGFIAGILEEHGIKIYADLRECRLYCPKVTYIFARQVIPSIEQRKEMLRRI